MDSTLPDDAWLAGRSDEIGHFKEAFDIPDAELQQVARRGPARNRGVGTLRHPTKHHPAPLTPLAP